MGERDMSVARQLALTALPVPLSQVTGPLPTTLSVCYTAAYTVTTTAALTTVLRADFTTHLVHLPFQPHSSTPRAHERPSEYCVSGATYCNNIVTGTASPTVNATTIAHVSNHVIHKRCQLQPEQIRSAPVPPDAEPSATPLPTG